MLVLLSPSLNVGFEELETGRKCLTMSVVPLFFLNLLFFLLNMELHDRHQRAYKLVILFFFMKFFEISGNYIGSYYFQFFLNMHAAIGWV